MCNPVEELLKAGVMEEEGLALNLVSTTDLVKLPSPLEPNVLTCNMLVISPPECKK